MVFTQLFYLIQSMSQKFSRAFRLSGHKRIDVFLSLCYYTNNSIYTVLISVFHRQFSIALCFLYAIKELVLEN